jgi:hydroxypyruvate isomerase
VPRLAANVSMLFGELAFLDRFDAAARHRFGAVECLFPYEHPAAELARRLETNGLTLALFNAPPGDWASGERGLAALPGREDEFRAGVRTAAEYAAATGCRRVHVMAGVGGDEHCYAANVAWAAQELQAGGATAVIEPLNPFDMPGYHLASSASAVRVCELTGARLQADLYHLRRLGEDPAEVLRQHLDLVGHVQTAGVPDRHEPDSEEDRDLFALLDVLGYQGWVGCEYRPRSDLSWAAGYGIDPAPPPGPGRRA